MVEYNLTQHLIDTFASYNFVTNGFAEDTVDNVIMIQNNGGDVDHWYDRTNYSIQILGRNNSVVTGKEQIVNVYNELKNRFGLLLPAVTVDSVVYPAVQTWQISPIQFPGKIGVDDRGLAMYSFNVVITTK